MIDCRCQTLCFTKLHNLRLATKIWLNQQAEFDPPATALDVYKSRRSFAE